MAIATRTETIPMPDGGAMDAYVAVPEAGGGPGVLVLQEIFGVGTYIRGATDRLAELGYVALAPDLYRRTRPGAQFGKGEAALKEAFAAVSSWTCRARSRTRSSRSAPCATLPEVRRRHGRARLLPRRHARLRSRRSRPTPTHWSPTTALGSRRCSTTPTQVSCPALFHFGAQDPYIPLEQSERVADAAASRPGWEVEIQPDGGHAFDNWDNPMFHQPEPAARAWDLTQGFLARTLPT